MLTNNLSVDNKLANGSTGIVRDIVYKKGAGKNDLPAFVLVEFEN